MKISGKKILSQWAFAFVVALFLGGIIYAVRVDLKNAHRKDMHASCDVDSSAMEAALSDSLYRSRCDSLMNRHRQEYLLMDTIVKMSQAIREKECGDYSRYYWKWLQDCNVQIGSYLRRMGRYHGLLYYSDMENALDSVDTFVDVFMGDATTQGDMNTYAEVCWVLDFLRTEEVYQLLMHNNSVQKYRNAVFRDFQYWFWTTEALSFFYYEVIEGGDEGSGTMAPMELAYMQRSISRLHRKGLLDDLRALYGKNPGVGKTYGTVTMRDFEMQKRKYVDESNRFSLSKLERKRRVDRVVVASDSLIHEFGRWMAWRDSVESSIADEQKKMVLHRSTQRIRWNMYLLFKNDFEVSRILR